jgi:hypothetical protein
LCSYRDFLLLTISIVGASYTAAAASSSSKQQQQTAAAASSSSSKQQQQPYHSVHSVYIKETRNRDAADITTICTTSMAALSAVVQESLLLLKAELTRDQPSVARASCTLGTLQDWLFNRPEPGTSFQVAGKEHSSRHQPVLFEHKQLPVTVNQNNWSSLPRQFEAHQAQKQVYARVLYCSAHICFLCVLLAGIC